MSLRRRLISKGWSRRFTGAVCGAMLGAARAFAAPDALALSVFDSIQKDVQSVFEKCQPAIAKIEAVDAHGRLSGTGFFIDPSGTLYTSYTVGGESRDITVHFAGRQFPATRIVSDLRSGVALLKIEAQTPFLTFGRSCDLAVASPVIAIGYPMDMPLTPAFGTVGGLDRKYSGRYFSTAHIRANIAVQRGEGGAPLLNPQGEVVGILISRLDSGSASFVLPIEAAEKVRKDFVRFREVRPGWLGLHVKDVVAADQQSTAWVEEVICDAPAQKAGLQVGDRVLQIGDRKIATTEDLIDASFFLTADDCVQVQIVRHGEPKQFTIQPCDPPNSLRTTPTALGTTTSFQAPALEIGK